jgi:transcription antitermination factor NusA-like protein
VKVPICTFDAKTGILCPKCETKLKAGHLTRTDVDASVKLIKLADRMPELNKLSLVRAFDVDGAAVLLVGSGELAPLRHNPDILRRVEGELGRKTWVVEAETTDRKLLEDLFYPIRILTVNVVWLPDGSKLTKVIIPGRRTERFPLDLEHIKRIVKTVRGIDLLVEFERS